jgi:hypothetical protein
MAFGVFQLCLSQGRLGTGTPMDGLQTAIDIALQYHLPKHIDLSRLIRWLQCEVRVIPFAPDTVALKAIALAIHGFKGEVAGFPP